VSRREPRPTRSFASRSSREGAVRRMVAAVAVLHAVGTGAATAAAQDLAPLFPEEADVLVPASGLSRLPLPAEVLDACTPDLADLRLFDRAGREVPYLIDPGVPIGGERREMQLAEPRVLDLAREEIPRPDRMPLTREIYRLEPPPDAKGGAWSLVFEVSQPRFVRSVEVRSIRDDGSAVTAVPRASLVRLGQRLVDRDVIALPEIDGDEVVVTIEGEEGFFLEPRLRYARERALAGASPLDVPLVVLETRRADGRTIVSLERPPGLVTSRLRLFTSTPVLDRHVTVWDVAPSGASTRIGEGRVVRAPGRDGAPLVEETAIPVGRSRGRRLDVVIEDADSPPLADLRIASDVSRPAIVFALPAAAPGEPAGVLRFGGDRAWRPRYDVADLFADAIAASGRADLADAAALAEAHLGAIRPNPLFDPRPALAPWMRPGSAVDANQWRWRRSLVVPESPEGLVRVPLVPEDLAAALPDRSDLRVVDAASRQWPFLLAPATAQRTLELGAGAPVREGGTSRIPIALPSAPLVLDEVTIVPAQPVLHRPYKLLTRTRDGGERILATGVLGQSLRRPEPIHVAFAPAEIEALELLVVDGDDAPFDVARVETALALPDLLVVAPAGEYALLAGNPDAEPPRHEIARARDVILGLRSVPATTGPGAVNESWTGTPGGSARSRARLEQSAVWAAIAVAVLVLGALTLRLARAEPRRRS
jgi:hypothetical protein